MVLGLVILPGTARAQNPPPVTQDTAAARRAMEQQLGRSISQSEILERLRQSGMTRAQMRTRLQQAGYDPSLADAYFDALERGAEPPSGDPSPRFVEALNRIGLARRPAEMELDSLGRRIRGDTMLVDSLLPPDPDTMGPREQEVFGVRTFRRAGTQFEPMLFGPVDSGYRLGPGDELTLILTGDIEEAYALGVSREGFVFIPDVGQISVNGLTLAELEDVLYTRLGRVYSGISRSPNASTRFQVSVGRLRANQVVVTGDVVRPGSYQVSSAGGLFNALYQAGGPTTGGSFRHVEVHRGGRLFHTADLYDFLVGGSGASDIRLENGDRIFVPPAGAQVRVEGAVRRPMVYEVRSGEGVRELIVFAGGLRSDALVRRIQVDRIVPPAERRPGYYRTLVDVELAQLGPEMPSVPLYDGDLVTISAVSDVRRNRVWLEGEVRNPGLYEWSAGSTLWSLIERADGLGELAYTSRAHIYRYVETDGTRTLIQASLERSPDGTPLHDPPLMDNDSVVVLSRRDLRTAEFVTIDGFVKEPDTYPLARGMTLRDLILAAEGFSHGAYLLEAEVSRMPDPLTRTDTTAYVFRVPLTAGNGSGNGADGDILPHWLPQAGELQLQHGDRVFIRRAPGYEPVREVRVSGEVLVPGRYVLATRDERIADVIRRAGGITPQAYAPGMHVVREGNVVAADLQRALRDPSNPNNILLVAGDSIHVPTYDATVRVTGAVNFEARVLYVPGQSLDYYISQAGGYQDDADRDRITVTYQSGERAAVNPRWVGRWVPRVQPGSQIFVPQKPADEGGIDWDQVVGRGAAILSAIATAMFAISQLR